MGLVSRYVAYMSLRRDGACYSNIRMRCLERHGELGQRSSYLRLERGAARMRDVGKKGALVLCAETCIK